ncbi:MAG: HNH endonuclease [Actinobacteria bacterium]|nr:HNH endonuclease [Actinomycetota bacterium]
MRVRPYAGDVTAPRHHSRRLAATLARRGNRCQWCGREVDTPLVAATVDHLVPRIKGGPTWAENLVVACGRCNADRGHLTPADWLDECDRRGWRPDRSAVVLALRELQSAIVHRGGQRRARRYVASQLRRLSPGPRRRY